MKKKTQVQKSPKAQSKEQLIERLLAKASLDFRCCGHCDPKDRGL